MQDLVDHIYAPVVGFTTVRVARALAVQRGYFVHQMDVRTAFLHGVINEDVYISPPRGTGIDVRNGQALRLMKELYGLKQEPRLWFEKWLEVRTRLGLEAWLSDKCVFGREEMWVLLYVDDVIIMGKEMENIEKLKKQLSSQLEMKRWYKPPTQGGLSAGT